MIIPAPDDVGAGARFRTAGAPDDQRPPPAAADGKMFMGPRRRRSARALAGPRRRLARRYPVVLLTAALATLTGVLAGPQLTAQAAPPAGSPIGVATHMWFQPGGMRFIGWALDPNTSAPINVAITVDSRTAATVLADDPRPDVAQAHPGAGPNHGFDTFVKISEGHHTVCVWARNTGKGADTKMRCQDRVLDYGPVGSVQSVQGTAGSVAVSGWTMDYDDRTAPLTVWVTVDGSTATLLADKPNSDAEKALPSAGPDHGFSYTKSVGQGSHNVCVRAKNIGYGSDNTLKCSTVTVNDSPRAGLDSATQQPGKLHVVGWAYDPNELTKALSVAIKIDGTTHTVVAAAYRPDIAKKYPGIGNDHGFDAAYSLPGGTHTVCVTAHNVGYGSDMSLPCRTVTLNFSPSAHLYHPMKTATGILISGYASDPDTSAPISVHVTANGKTTTLLANHTGTTNSGHKFGATLPMTSGSHQVCVVALNVLYGHSDSPPSCQTVNFAYSPIGAFETLRRAPGSADMVVTGWAFDPDTSAPLTIAVKVGSNAKYKPLTANARRDDIATKYPGYGVDHGISSVIAASDHEHHVCLTAKNVSGGTDLALGCQVIDAVHPNPPGAPQHVTAQAGYGQATVTWAAPQTDGGAPWSSYTVTAAPGGASVTVGPTATSATVTGLASKTTYTFAVTAGNVAGASAPGVSPSVTTPAGPPPQTSPAPVSTSRYIRNIHGSSGTEQARLRAEGVADAQANPAGHGYLILLDIGGQDQFDGGVVLSATTRFVSYGDLQKDLQAYVDGYHSAQRSGAPVTVAVGTNNDMDVTAVAGEAWAQQVINPLAAHAKNYAGMTIAGANDIEPGFRASYRSTYHWLLGYLLHTSAPFVFNGSADGCSWTATGRGCNNGWTMSGLYWLSAGAGPEQIRNLPQIYNTTMAAQWKYISLTGIGQGHPRINFGGPLTEWTACDQTHSCGSLTGHTAWSTLWSNLQSDSRLKVASLPYSTDLRIDS